jgi:hypothetical protein
MLEQTPSRETVSPLSAVDFEELLRLLAVNARLVRFGKGSNRDRFPPVDFSPIEETAGAIWQFLSDNGRRSTARMMEDLGLPDSLCFVAIG